MKDIASIEIFQSGDSLEEDLKRSNSCVCQCRCGGSCGSVGIPTEQQPVDFGVYDSIVNGDQDEVKYER